MGKVHILKSKLNRYFLSASFITLFITGGILSCSSSSGGGDAVGTATIPAVVFIADNDSDGNKELYVSLNDGASVLMLSTGGDVKDFKISPDGSRVAYRADQDSPGVIELYVISINGGASVKVSRLDPLDPLTPNPNVEVLQVVPPFTFDVFNWSPDSAMIAYIADQENDTVYELFVSTPDGSSNFKVSGNLNPGAEVIDFEWSPDSSRMAYRADHPNPNKIELYTTTPTLTPTPVKVSLLVPGAGDVVASEVLGPTAIDLDAFEWSPDSSRIAYLADGDRDNVIELYTAEPTVIESPVTVSALPPSPTNDRDVTEFFKWALDNSRVAYIADQDTNDIFELYSSPPDTSTGNVKLNPNTLVFGQNVTSFEWAPDSLLIAYIADQDTNDIFELYSSPPDTSTGNVKLNPNTFVLGQNITSFEWAPDSLRIAYLADQDFVGIFELYSSQSDGSGNVNISVLLVPNGNVSAFEYGP
jgi:Tol biopolymer transport system component